MSCNHPSVRNSSSAPSPERKRQQTILQMTRAMLGFLSCSSWSVKLDKRSQLISYLIEINKYKFIRDWASDKLSNREKQPQLNNDSDEETYMITNQMLAVREVVRRNAICEKNTEKVIVPSKKVAKREEHKSKIMLTLRNIELLKSIGLEYLWEMVEEAEIIEVQAGEVILDYNQVISNLFIVIEGSLLLQKAKSTQRDDTYLEGMSFCQNCILYDQQNIWGFYKGRSQTSQVACIPGQRIRFLVIQANKTLNQSIFKALASINLFKLCCAEELDKIISLARNSELVHVSRDQIVIRENQHKDCFYYVMTGEFGQSLKELSEPLGKQSIIKYQYGQFFGEQCLESDKLSESTVIALEDGELICIHVHDLQRCLGSLSKIRNRRNRR